MMAPVPVMEEHTWHIRGVKGTHLGPYNEYNTASFAYGHKTECGLIMDLRYVPGMANGDHFDPAAVCETCWDRWWGR